MTTRQRIASVLQKRLASMSYEEAKREHDILEERVSLTGAALRAFPRDGRMGLVTESARTSPEYRAAKAAGDSAFTALRDFNSVFVKMFAKEMRAERAARGR